MNVNTPTLKKDSQQLFYERFDTAENLPSDEVKLLEQALEATETAYAPHSGFFVGAAVALTDGQVIKGNNQENLAYPSGLCAERTALFYAGSLGKGDQVEKIAIRGRSSRIKLEVPVTPCGACRQVMLEYENLSGKPIIVLMQGEEGPILRLSGVADTLLPFSFNIEF